VSPAPVVRGEAKPAVLRDKPYALISFLKVIMLLRMPVISLAIPLWIIERTGTGEDGVVAVAVMLFRFG
jgi:hypothetical protein